MPTSSGPFTQPEVPEVRFLGKSWYKRGFTYWVKRIRYLVAYVGISVFPVVAVAAFFNLVIDKTRSWGRVALLVAGCLAICWSLYIGFRAVLRSIQEEKLIFARHQPPSEEEAERKAGAGAGLGLGVAAYGGSALAGGLIVVGQLFVVGWLFAHLVKSSRRYLSPEEARAVSAVRDWYRAHPEIPDEARPRQFRRH